jgi:hypothetical protein
MPSWEKWQAATSHNTHLGGPLNHVRRQTLQADSREGLLVALREVCPGEIEPEREIAALRDEEFDQRIHRGHRHRIDGDISRDVIVRIKDRYQHMLLLLHGRCHEEGCTVKRLLKFVQLDRSYLTISTFIHTCHLYTVILCLSFIVGHASVV